MTVSVLLLIVTTATMPIGTPFIDNGYLHVPIYKLKSNGTDTIPCPTLEASVSEIAIRQFSSFLKVSGPARVYQHDEDGRQYRDNPIIMERPVEDLVFILEDFDSLMAEEVGASYEDTTAESQMDLRDCICEVLRSSGLVSETGKEGLFETDGEGCLLWNGKKVQRTKVRDGSPESF